MIAMYILYYRVSVFTGTKNVAKKMTKLAVGTKKTQGLSDKRMAEPHKHNSHQVKVQKSTCTTV